MFTPLSPRQRQVYEFVLCCWDKQGIFPSVREIQAEFGFQSSNAAYRHLVALEKRGMLKRISGKARMFEIPQRASGPVIRVPLLGTIPAGMPAYTEVAFADEMIAVDLRACAATGSYPLFALRVKGSSMTGAAILEGDTAILEVRAAQVGDIVAALIDGDVTLKRLSRDGNRLVLRAENPEYPKIVPLDNLTVQGVLVGIQRKIT